MHSSAHAILTGKVAATPESFRSRSGKPYVTFPLATERDTTSEGEEKPVVDFHRIVASDNLLDVCAQLRTGDEVQIEGSLLIHGYEKNGERRFATEIHVVSLRLTTA